uniref:Uncharacterized protein n=1 Tax=Oreochromis niloticus TaxID=8128 RepID=A0A669CWC9_ORENI
MFFRLPRLTPGYIRLLQVSKTVPGMAMVLGAVGIGMCGYSSKQLALCHRPSSRVLQLIGTHTDASPCVSARAEEQVPSINKPWHLLV